MQQNSFEEALSLCVLSGEQDKRTNDGQTTKIGGADDIIIQQIHEQYAFSLHQKGDFEGAVTQYIAAETSVASVIMLFPELIPNSLLTVLNSVPTCSVLTSDYPAAIGYGGVMSPTKPTPKLSGMILQRAASALLTFCEHHRAEVNKAAELALQQRSLAAQANLTNILQEEAVDVRDMGAHDSDERIRTSVLLDTVMIASDMICNPPR